MHLKFTYSQTYKHIYKKNARKIDLFTKLQKQTSSEILTSDFSLVCESIFMQQKMSRSIMYLSNDMYISNVLVMFAIVKYCQKIIYEELTINFTSPT